MRLPLHKQLLFGAGLGWHKACEAVVDDQLAVVFAIVFDEAVGGVDDPELLVRKRIDEGIVQAFVSFGLDGGGAVGEGFLNEGDDVGLGLVLVALGVFRSWRLLACRRIDEEVIRPGSVQELLGEAALGGGGFEVVFIFWEIFGHGDELAADVVPGIKDNFIGRVCGLGRLILLRVLRGKSDGCGEQGYGEKREPVHLIFSWEVTPDIVNPRQYRLELVYLKVVK